MPLRIGVVGCGVIGPSHMAAAARCQDIELVAVADRITDRHQEAARRFGVPRTFSEGSDLVADPEVDAVVLAFPAAQRGALALEALAHGKHVLLEKPVAMGAQEASAISAARGQLTVACCSSRYRFTASARAATATLASGALGALRLVRIRATSTAGPLPEGLPPVWRLRRDLNGGGILMNWGGYDLDFALGLLGWSLTPQTVLAQTWQAPPAMRPGLPDGSDAETHGVALVRCAEGVVLFFERGEYLPAASDAAWEFLGEAGALRVHMTASEPASVVLDHYDPQAGVVSDTVFGEDQDMGDVHDGPVTDFARAVLTGGSPLTTIDQASLVQRITDAVYESAASGAMVSV